MAAFLDPKFAIKPATLLEYRNAYISVHSNILASMCNLVGLAPRSKHKFDKPQPLQPIRNCRLYVRSVWKAT